MAKPRQDPPAQEPENLAPMVEFVVAQIGVNPEQLFHRHRVAIDRMAELDLEIAGLKAERAELEATYGLGANTAQGQLTEWEHDRKVLLSKIKERVRKDGLAGKYSPDNKSEKLSNDRVDDIAHIDPEYTAFLDRSRADRKRFTKLGSDIAGKYAELGKARRYAGHIEHRLKYFDAMAYLTGNEMKLAR
jgi:hypothetical protein